MYCFSGHTSFISLVLLTAGGFGLIRLGLWSPFLHSRRAWHSGGRHPFRRFWGTLVAPACTARSWPLVSAIMLVPLPTGTSLAAAASMPHQGLGLFLHCHGVESRGGSAKTKTLCSSVFKMQSQEGPMRCVIIRRHLHQLPAGR
jgi:hypothetical protein